MSQRVRKEGLEAWFEALLIAVLLLQFAHAFVVRTFYIPSGSMEDTLLVGDYLFVNRFIYGPTLSELERNLLPVRDWDRGDIVIFHSVEEPELDVVKRCVALGGDTVEVSSKSLYLNGSRLEDSAYVRHKDRNVFPRPRGRPGVDTRDNFGPISVPEGHAFCFGDNRDFSRDSRVWGPLPRSHVRGRAFMIYWSNAAMRGEGPRAQERGSDALVAPRWGRILQVVR
ncbi:MAG: signal peptidase I [Acidobacteriota bacterium]